MRFCACIMLIIASTGAMMQIEGVRPSASNVISNYLLLDVKMRRKQDLRKLFAFAEAKKSPGQGELVGSIEQFHSLISDNAIEALRPIFEKNDGFTQEDLEKLYLFSKAWTVLPVLNVYRRNTGVWGGMSRLGHIDAHVEFLNAMLFSKDPLSFLQSRRLKGTQELDFLKGMQYISFFKGKVKGRKILVYVLASIFHDIGYFPFGEERAQYFEPYLKSLLDVFVKKGFISFKEKKLIVALGGLHDLFNTLQFGEGNPYKIKTYLESRDIALEEYLPLTVCFFIQDVSSVGSGVLADDKLSCISYLGYSYNFLGCLESWHVFRVYLGFLRNDNNAIDFSQMRELVNKRAHSTWAKYHYAEQQIEEKELERFHLFLNSSVHFSGYAYKIFRGISAVTPENLLKVLFALSKYYTFIGEESITIEFKADHLVKFIEQLHAFVRMKSVQDISDLTLETFTENAQAVGLSFNYSYEANTLQIGLQEHSVRHNLQISTEVQRSA